MSHSSVNSTEKVTPSEASANMSASYEAPAIESVLSPDDLQREVFYAGTVNSDGNVPPDTGP